MLHNVRPVRLSRRPEPFDSDEYLYELKIDGLRSLAHIFDGRGDLIFRNGISSAVSLNSPPGSLNT
jgi:ATP-dependent DNA ligase